MDIFIFHERKGLTDNHGLMLLLLLLLLLFSSFLGSGYFRAKHPEETLSRKLPIFQLLSRFQIPCLALRPLRQALGRMKYNKKWKGGGVRVERSELRRKNVGKNGEKKEMKERKQKKERRKGKRRFKKTMTKNLCEIKK